MGTTIYYFSATGNSLMVARDIAAELGDAKLVSIPQAMDSDRIDLTDDCIGLLLPVYFLGLPVIAVEFIKKLKLDSSKYIFTVLHYGNFPGSAADQLRELIEEQGVKVAASYITQLPENYVIMYDAPDAAGQEKQIADAKAMAKEVAGAVKAKKTVELKRNGMPMKLLSAIVYRHSKKFKADAKKFWVQDTCNGCGSCQKVCPVGNVELEGGRPKWGGACEQCLACVHWCPKAAIESGKGTKGRKRYTNPHVKMADIIASARGK